MTRLMKSLRMASMVGSATLVAAAGMFGSVRMDQVHGFQAGIASAHAQWDEKRIKEKIREDHKNSPYNEQRAREKAREEDKKREERFKNIHLKVTATPLGPTPQKEYTPPPRRADPPPPPRSGANARGPKCGPTTCSAE